MDHEDSMLVSMLNLSSGQSPIDSETMKRAARRIEVLCGTIDFVYIPVRHMTERADKYEKRCKELEAEIAAIKAADWR